MSKCKFGLVESNVIEAVEKVLGITWEQLASKKRDLLFSYARIIASHLMAENGIKVNDIANAMNRDHSTIIPQVQKYESEYKYNSEFREYADKVENRFKNISVAKEENAKEIFVSVENAILLKKIGFKAPCAAFVCGDDDICFIRSKTCQTSLIDIFHNSLQEEELTLVPTFQSALDWIMNNKEMYIFSLPVFQNENGIVTTEWCCIAQSLFEEKIEAKNFGTFGSLNEAMNAGIERVLKNEINDEIQ